MNRREFLKGTLGGVFGAFLTWAGMVRGEEVEPAPDAQDMEQEVSGFIDWVNREVVPTWDGQVSDNVSGDYTDYSPNTGSAYPSWASRDGEWGDARNFQHRPDSDLGRVFSQNGKIDWPRTREVLEEIGILPRAAYPAWESRGGEATDFYWCHQGCSGYDAH